MGCCVKIPRNYLLHLLAPLTCLLINLGCSNAASTSSGSGNSSATNTGTLAVGGIQGQVLAKDGAPSTSVQGATVAVDNHPELATKTDGNGNYSIKGMLPGQLAIMVTSQSSALSATTTYGIRLTDVLVKPGEVTQIGTKTMKEIGSIKGKVTFFENPNNLDVTGTDVYIPGTSFMAKTDSSGNFSMTGVPEGTYELRAQHAGFAVMTLQNIEVLEAKATDIGEVQLSLSVGPEGGITVLTDKTATMSGATVKISTSRTVAINLTYDNDAALMKISDEPSFLNKSWRAVSKTSSWTFASDGAKSLYVMFSDLNGLESSPFNADLYVDTTAPTLSSVVILNGWTQTASLAVFADIVGSDVGSGIAEVMISNIDSTFSASVWQPYSNPINWTLSSGEGAKTIYLKVRDYAGRESNVVQDGINKGSQTKIAAAEYENKLKLYAAQSPYFIEGYPVFNQDLEVEAGTTINIKTTSIMTVKGVFKTAGTSTSHVVIQRDVSDITTCATTLDLMSGGPGVSEQNRISFTDFKDIKEIKFNGGIVDHAKFESTSVACGGINYKYGEDNLFIQNSTFVTWYNAMEVHAGNGNAVLRGNTGSVATAVSQLSGASGTQSILNTLTTTQTGAGDFYLISAGSFLSDGDNLTGYSSLNLFNLSGASSSVTGITTVKNLTATTCSKAFKLGVSTGQTYAITGGTFTSCPQ